MSLRNVKLAIAILAGSAFACSVPAISFARGGGHGGGGHAGGHAGGHYGGFHSAGNHPYRPTENHFANHDPNRQEHHDDHYNHHHNDWHHNGWWGPGFWGGMAAGYGLGWGLDGWGGYGGNTYVDDSDNSDSTTDYQSTDDGQNDSDMADNSQAQQRPFPVDSWPELGISTYDGQYGSQQGVVVVRVVPNSAAARAGFVPGDVILSFNGQPVSDSATLDGLMDSAKGRFEATVWDGRTGRKSSISGTLDQSAQQPAAAAPQLQR